MTDPPYHINMTMKNKLTTEQFIQRSLEKHGDRYDYSATSVSGVDRKAVIGCPVHGSFEQRAADHMAGRGCSLCNERQKMTKETFVARANQQHGSKYSYGGVNYKNVTTKVRITCLTHGDFLQTPKDHLHGYGCPSCGGTKKATTKDFIRRANQVHEGFYQYHNVDLQNMNRDVEIECPIHGIFLQRPADHLNGVGCPECSLLKRGRYCEEYFINFPEERGVQAELYLVTVGDSFCKVGITKRSVAQRFGTSSVRLIAKHQTSLKEAYEIEQQILERFKSSRFRASGLRSRGFSGWTECFPMSLLPDLQAEFQL